MKTLLTGLVVFGATMLGAWAYHVHTRSAPDISVYLFDDAGGGGGPGLPEIDGYVNGDSGTDGSYTHSATYKVVSNSAGKFFVLAHYHVEHTRVSSEFDQALPVFEQKPDESEWAQLNPHLKACAFLTGGTINY
jgi:hypothetical protein